MPLAADGLTINCLFHIPSLLHTYWIDGKIPLSIHPMKTKLSITVGIT